MTAPARLRLTCPDCGPQPVDPDDLQVTYTLDGTSRRAEFVGWFTCPSCSANVGKVFHWKTVQKYRALGVRIPELPPFREDDARAWAAFLDRAPTVPDGGQYGCNGYTNEEGWA